MRHSTSRLRWGRDVCASAPNAPQSARTAAKVLGLLTMVDVSSMLPRLSIIVLATDAGKCGVAPTLFHRLKNLVGLMLKS
ncbi:hypothetical protein [Aquabacterium sp.]|uniref:hypothetical protein n=1 Tax=Aquabacterium sp. TaxID=1872578 RepID=UPI003D6D7E58